MLSDPDGIVQGPPAVDPLTHDPHHMTVHKALFVHVAYLPPRGVEFERVDVRLQAHVGVEGPQRQVHLLFSTTAEQIGWALSYSGQW